MSVPALNVFQPPLYCPFCHGRLGEIRIERQEQRSLRPPLVIEFIPCGHRLYSRDDDLSAALRRNGGHKIAQRLRALCQAVGLPPGWSPVQPGAAPVASHFVHAPVDLRARLRPARLSPSQPDAMMG